MRLCVVGDIYQDFVALQLTTLPTWGSDRTVDRIVSSLGGSAANTARHVSGVFGTEVETRLLGAVGSDAVGSTALRTLAESGLCTWTEQDTHAQVVPGATGACIVLSGVSDRAFVSCNGPNDVFQPAQCEAAVHAINTADHVHIHGYFNCSGLQSMEFLDVLKAAKHKNPRLSISLDTQFDAKEEWAGENLNGLLGIAEFFFPNEAESVGVLRGISPNGSTATFTADAKQRDVDTTQGDNPPQNDSSVTPRTPAEDLPEGRTREPCPLAASASIASAFPSLCVVQKLGEDGCALFHNTLASPCMVETTVRTVVDTTGAGDAFDAGFLGHWLATERGASFAECAAKGNALGGVAVTRAGACDPPLNASDLV